MVQFGDQLGVYSPACLIPAPGKKIDMIKNASTSTTTPGAPASTRKGKMIYFTPLVICMRYKKLYIPI
jgi:hypothetical protein